jgi:hypothetical protein
MCASLASIETVSSVHRTTIAGRTIAYAKPLACLNGIAYWSMIIHVQRTKAVRVEFIRVNFSLPCGESSKWFSAKPTLQNFNLIRDKKSDEVLEEFMEFADESKKKGLKQDSSFTIWKRLPGTEQEKLPFGQVVPSYKSVDPPLQPVL